MIPVIQSWFLFLSLWLISHLAEATISENIVHNIRWDGYIAYMPVDRRLVQDRLDSWYNSISNVCGGPRLYLPEEPVFPDILNKDQHVVYFDTGYVKHHDFEDFPDKSVSVNGLEFAVVIPLLADHPKGHPKYSLALSKFYQRDRGDFPQPNLAFPYIPVDVLKMNETNVYMRNGDDEMKVSYERLVNPCEPAIEVSRHELDEFITQEFQLGVPEPDFSFCDRHPSENQVCQTLQSIRCDLHRSSPNICQSSWNSEERMVCFASAQVTRIDKWFRDFMMLGNGPAEVIASDSLTGNFSLGLKYPCLE
ncbi:hypothetical protein HOLleu_04328 [Holothuria leucospilota]|uniref:Uncharacterized protein n=1 Tax=Holothuria leucospilota TaxID=206669 RepID=A0A9Q1HLT5_HOLLE|nr:hypothetical protein HOLleu_04328 [Holothuria leucospilota]